MAKSAKKTTSKKTASKKSSNKATYTKADPKPAVRKVAAPASARSRSTVAASASSGSTPLTSYGLHTYRVTKTPDACRDWAVGNYVEIYVSEPPPATLTFADGDDCDGTEVTLIS